VQFYSGCREPVIPVKQEPNRFQNRKIQAKQLWNWKIEAATWKKKGRAGRQNPREKS
jgi:hypothetical protein